MLNRKIAIGVSVPVMALALSATASFANSNEGTVTADALNVRSFEFHSAAKEVKFFS